MTRFYIVAELDEADNPDHRIALIDVKPPQACDHTSRICATAECLNSWSNDWTLYLERTASGRSMLDMIDAGML